MLIEIEARDVVVGMEISRQQMQLPVAEGQSQMFAEHPSLMALQIEGAGGIELGLGRETAVRGIGGVKAQTVAVVIDQQFMGGIIALAQSAAQTQRRLPAVAFVVGLQHQVNAVRGLRDEVACPGTVGIVGIGRKRPVAQGLPLNAQIVAALVLHLAAIAEAVGVERRVAIAVEALQGHDAEVGKGLETQGVDGGQMTILIECRLTVERITGSLDAIAETHIGEASSVGIIATVERLTIGLQRTVKLRKNTIDSQGDAIVLIGQRTTCRREMGVVLLVSLGGCAMIAGGEQCGCGAIGIERSINRTVGGEGSQGEWTPQTNGGPCALKVIGLGA